MNQELVNSETTQIVPQSSWGSEGVDRGDVLIPKLLLQQALSKFVVDGKAKAGDLVDSLTGEVLGDKNTPVEVIPFLMTKSFRIMELEGNKYEYRRIEPITPENTDSALEYEEGGKKFRRDRCLNFFLLLANQAGQADAFPYAVTFTRTSLTAGKLLATHFAKMAMLKAPPASKTLNLSCSMVKNDLGSFYVFGVTSGRATAPGELSNAYNWYKTLSTQKHRIDDSDLNTEAEVKTNEGPVQF
jgi:hypothetical protein